MKKIPHKANAPKTIKIIPILLVAVILVFILAGVILAANYAVEYNARGKTFDTDTEIKKNRVGLVLGTSKRVATGQLNLYFLYRVEAAVKLYNAGKIQFILVSGDNSQKEYNEPMDLKRALIKAGIPSEHIFLDYAGFRTLDSIVRAKKIFNQTSITIISQKFHNERAIYIAEKNGMDAVGFNARAVEGRVAARTNSREYLARVKLFIDLLFNVEPKFLGEKIEIK